jgi:hypothetical protein
MDASAINEEESINDDKGKVEETGRVRNDCADSMAASAAGGTPPPVGVSSTDKVALSAVVNDGCKGAVGWVGSDMLNGFERRVDAAAFELRIVSSADSCGCRKLSGLLLLSCSGTCSSLCQYK